ncbi:YceH family protein [Azoarcus sp. L1K30]|uniref:YceH family protein n=1 Tax=Azoarcus sp. L1K30 TaxID=2820277 RepID=UPI001B81687C|nr:YceH family protein [Azoarcus sp. L1K30]MBR0566702.1 YceH family protein [Azoarcus sp. L1K30]
MDNTPTATDAAFDLDPIEIRVLGVLIEKAFVTPDAYPMSLNALVGGCNQLTARDPVMSLSEAEVQNAIDSLMSRRLVTRRDQASARVAKYEHQVRLRHSLPPAEQAVLATLLLRGAQTAGEIRSRCDRLHHFDDISTVEAALEHLSEKYPPMVASLPRAPGTKETRHMHLLGGDGMLQAAIEVQASGAVPSGGGRGRTAELEDEVRRLREELDALKLDFADFRRQFE